MINKARLEGQKMNDNLVSFVQFAPIECVVASIFISFLTLEDKFFCNIQNNHHCRFLLEEIATCILKS
ncbi:hypothetical protein ACJX0J_036293, partial [Zea mays]